jgi:hypothetical protein
MALRFRSASAVYHQVQPVGMRARVVTLPSRPGSDEVEVRRHGREPVTFGGAVWLVADSEYELFRQRQAWEREQGEPGTLQTGSEFTENVRLLDVEFGPVRRLTGTRGYLCSGQVTFRQESR